MQKEALRPGIGTNPEKERVFPGSEKLGNKVVFD